MTIVLYCETRGEARLVCAQAGCEDCLAAILRENQALICAVIRGQWLGQANGVDLTQVGRIALWYAVRRYDPQRGVRFSTYAWKAIRHRVWQEVARVSKATGWLAAPPHQDQMGELNGEWQRAQVREALTESLMCLSERQRQVIELHYGWQGGAPQSLREIGQAWGVTYQRVSQIHQEALILLRAPSLSIRLRSLAECDGRKDYREALHKNGRWQRRYRGRA